MLLFGGHIHQNPSRHVHGESGVRELCCPAHVVHKVLAAMLCVADLPPIRQGAQFRGVNFNLSKPGVMPGADSGVAMNEVDLTLRGCPLLCSKGCESDQLTLRTRSSDSHHIHQVAGAHGAGHCGRGTCHGG